MVLFQIPVTEATTATLRHPESRPENFRRAPEEVALREALRTGLSPLEGPSHSDGSGRYTESAPKEVPATCVSLQSKSASRIAARTHASSSDRPRRKLSSCITKDYKTYWQLVILHAVSPALGNYGFSRL